MTREKEVMNSELRTALRQVLVAWAAVVATGLVPAAIAMAASGNFMAVVANDDRFKDSLRSVTYFDADAPSTPLFSVFLGFEDAANTNLEDLSAITVDPTTGDTYVAAFDSGVAGAVGNNETNGDLDLYKVNFSDVYSHWATNFEGRNIRSDGMSPMVGGPAPTGTNNQNNGDYVIYGNGAFSNFHSNTFAMAGSTEKIGEVNRGNGGDFFPFSLDFIDQDTLFLVDDSIGTPANDVFLDDHTYRKIKRVSTSPGAATSSTFVRSDGGTNYLNGGYNLLTTESWESTVIDFVHLDQPDVNGKGHSELRSSSYYNSGSVRGVWVSEGDTPAMGSGDVIAFLQLDANGNSLGYRPIDKPGNPIAQTISNDPAVTEDFKGKIGNIFVDQDSGDVIIIENGFADNTDGIGPDHEPAALRMHVASYDNGSGMISLAGWDNRVLLTPAKDPGGEAFLSRAAYGTWDSVNDRLFVVNPGGGSETPSFEDDVFVLDLKVGSPTYGQTTSHLNVDDDMIVFPDPFEDLVSYFSLNAVGLQGDFNNDHVVNAADYTTWRNNKGATEGTLLSGNGNGGVVDDTDYALWKAHYGESSAGSGGSAAGVAAPSRRAPCC